MAHDGGTVEDTGREPVMVPQSLKTGANGVTDACHPLYQQMCQPDMRSSHDADSDAPGARRVTAQRSARARRDVLSRDDQPGASKSSCLRVQPRRAVCVLFVSHAALAPANRGATFVWRDEPCAAGGQPPGRRTFDHLDPIAQRLRRSPARCRSYFVSTTNSVESTRTIRYVYTRPSSTH